MHLEKMIALDPSDDELWFDRCSLEEQVSNNQSRTREVYERAVSHVPGSQDKKFWVRYIYLWLNYAIFEEVQAKDDEKAR